MKRIAVLLIICAACLSACASTRWVQTAVVKQYDFVVSLEQFENKASSGQQQYGHPCEIDLATLKQLLGDLTYSEKSRLTGNIAQSPVFQAAEIDRLAPVFAEALAKADANQRIRFISFNQEPSVLFSNSRKTEGVIFIDADRRLNIAFNFINIKRLPSESSALYSSHSTADPLNVTASDTPLAASAPYAQPHQFETGRPAPMWLVADLQKLKETAGMEPIPAIRAEKEAPPQVTPKTGTVVEPVETRAVPPAAKDIPKEDIKNKLKFLKELLDEGLISEKDYNVKKSALLDKID